MKEIIAEVVEKLKRNLEVFFAEPGRGLDEAEQYLGKEISQTVCGLLGAYYEKLDAQLRKDKAGRREDGLVVERCGEKREVISLIGTVRYERTYYHRRAGGYEYPVDAVVGLEPYQRVSGGVGQALVETCCKMSYGDYGLPHRSADWFAMTALCKVRILRQALFCVLRKEMLSILCALYYNNHVCVYPAPLRGPCCTRLPFRGRLARTITTAN